MPRTMGGENETLTCFTFVPDLGTVFRFMGKVAHVAWYPNGLLEFREVVGHASPKKTGEHTTFSSCPANM